MISRKSSKIEVGKRTKQQQRIVPEPLQIAAKSDSPEQARKINRIWLPSDYVGQTLARANLIGFCQSEVTGPGWPESTIIII